MTGLHRAIEYNFLLAAHTKFSPDWCFGLVKQKTRKTFISSLFDIARAVEESLLTLLNLLACIMGQFLSQLMTGRPILATFLRRYPV